MLYPSITIHAVSRSGPSPTVYCQLEERGETAPGAEDDDGDEEDVITTELRINPSNPAAREFFRTMH